MTVELRHLRAIVAVSEHGSFTAAAIALGVSQAAVSRAVAELETELGAALALRTTRRVDLTESGREFLGDARRVLGSLDTAIARVRGHSTAIRVGYAWAALGSHTTAVLRGWNTAHPAEPLRMVRLNRRDAGLADGLVDVAVVRNQLTDAANDSIVIGTEPRLCVVAVDHPLAGRDVVRLDELLPFPVATDTVSGTTSAALWLDAGLPTAPPVVPTGDVDEWLDHIAAGDAIGVTSTATAQQYPRPGVVFVPIDDAPPIPVRLFWNRAHRHPATDRLARHLTAVYADGPPPSTAAEPRRDVGGRT